MTHGCLGFALAKLYSKTKVPNAYLSIAALGAIFPDFDYLLFWFNPYQFITVWHRGLTHSLLMLPLWAGLLSTLFYIFNKQHVSYRKLFLYACLGLLTHILTDLITIYGIQLFAPFNDHRYAFNLTFDIDPWLGGLIIFCLALSLMHRPAYVYLSLFFIACYLVTISYYRYSALNVIEAKIKSKTVHSESYYALPQPALPFHWQLVIDRADHYEIAHLSLFTSATEALASILPTSAPNQSKKPLITAADIRDYQAQDKLKWRYLAKFGNRNEKALALEVWQQAEFAEFRKFAIVPVLYRIDKDERNECAWFTDLRYIMPYSKPPFRYGMCREQEQRSWRLFRLERQSQNTRQRIKS